EVAGAASVGEGAEVAGVDQRAGEAAQGKGAPDSVEVAAVGEGAAGDRAGAVEAAGSVDRPGNVAVRGERAGGGAARAQLEGQVAEAEAVREVELGGAAGVAA